MSAVLAEPLPSLPDSVALTFEPTPERPCTLLIRRTYERGRVYKGAFIAVLQSTKTRKADKKTLATAVDCEGRARLDLEWDPCLWIGSTCFEVTADEAKRIEEVFASHGLRVVRKESHS